MKTGKAPWEDGYTGGVVMTQHDATFHMQTTTDATHELISFLRTSGFTDGILQITLHDWERYALGCFSWDGTVLYSWHLFRELYPLGVIFKNGILRFSLLDRTLAQAEDTATAIMRERNWLKTLPDTEGKYVKRLFTSRLEHLYGLLGVEDVRRANPTGSAGTNIPYAAMMPQPINMQAMSQAGGLGGVQLVATAPTWPSKHEVTTVSLSTITKLEKRVKVFRKENSTFDRRLMFEELAWSRVMAYIKPELRAASHSWPDDQWFTTVKQALRGGDPDIGEITKVDQHMRIIACFSANLKIKFRCADWQACMDRFEGQLQKSLKVMKDTLKTTVVAEQEYQRVLKDLHKIFTEDMSKVQLPPQWLHICVNVMVGMKKNYSRDLTAYYTHFHEQLSQHLRYLQQMRRKYSISLTNLKPTAGSEEESAEDSSGEEEDEEGVDKPKAAKTAQARSQGSSSSTWGSNKGNKQAQP